MDNENMEEDGNYPQYRSITLGPERSLQYVQERVERIEKSKKLGAEAVHRRKAEIFQKALENDAALTRIEKSQETIRKVGKAAAIGIVGLFAIKAANEGLGLIQWFLKRRKSRAKQTQRTEAKEHTDTGEEAEVSKELGKKSSSFHSTRLHARDWRICEPLE